MYNKELQIGQTWLLPHTCKAAGFIFAVAAFVAVFVAAYFHADKFLKECFVSMFIIGLLVAAMSKDRHEDEMLRSMRLTAFFSGFCWIALYVALYPMLVHWLHVHMPPAMAAVISMLFFYHTIFIFMKRRAHREKHD